MNNKVTSSFNIECSLTGRKWVGLDALNEQEASFIARDIKILPPAARTLARLNVAPSEVEHYLEPRLKHLMRDPMLLKDMKPAQERLLKAIEACEPIAIFADYDVDGAASGALLFHYFQNFGITPTLYVPDRLKEGYGPNIPAMQHLSNNHSLIICVDCGTLSHEAIEAATCDVVVIDHHLSGESLPPAVAVVNPNRRDEGGEFKNLCAAGVVFIVLVALNSGLREQGSTTPDLTSYLDLVALATIADIVPLKGLNRAFVHQGLKIMAGRNNIGLTALRDVAKITGTPKIYHLGFILGPLLNAGGRVGKADMSVRLLTCLNYEEAQGLAERLNMLNKERRLIENQVLIAASNQAEKRGYEQPLVWAAGEGWHPGVVGIVASRLKEKSNRPSIVIGFDGENGKGSGRSISGVDLGGAIQQLSSEGFIEQGGGHKMAAGLSLTRTQLEAAMARLTTLLKEQSHDKAELEPLTIDAALTPSAITIELIETLEKIGPFGAGAPAPRFALPFMRIAFAKRAGDIHLRLTLQDDSGSRIDAILFKAFETALGATLQNHNGRAFHIVGQVEIDEWNGHYKPKMRIEDAAFA